MTTFKIHTIESAPEGSKPILQQLENGIGFVPNLAATMANAPTVLKTYATMAGIFGEGSFSPVERELIMMTTSYINECIYCMAAHSTFAKAQGAADDVLEAVRSGKLPNNPRLAALISFTREVACNGGEVSEEDARHFLGAGFSQAQLLEVLIGVSQSSLASLVHRLGNVPVDEGFQPQAWAATAY